MQEARTNSKRTFAPNGNTVPARRAFLPPSFVMPPVMALPWLTAVTAVCMTPLSANAVPGQLVFLLEKRYLERSSPARTTSAGFCSAAKLLRNPRRRRVGAGWGSRLDAICYETIDAIRLLNSALASNL